MICNNFINTHSTGSYTKILKSFEIPVLIQKKKNSFMVDIFELDCTNTLLYLHATSQNLIHIVIERKIQIFYFLWYFISRGAKILQAY